jgi:hypothetical protein
MKHQNVDKRTAINWSNGKWQRNSIRFFNLCLVALFVSFIALPSNALAQCKRVTAGAMSVCVPSGWEVEKDIDKDKTSQITLTNDDEERLYMFMNMYNDDDMSLDEYMEIMQEVALVELDENLKWNKIKTITFQSRTARQVSGSFSIEGEHVYVSIIVFNGNARLQYAIIYISTSSTTSFPNDEITKSFRIE